MSLSTVKLTVKQLPKTRTIVISQDIPNSAFIATGDSIVISMDTLLVLLNYLVKYEYLNKKVISGMLEEANTL